MLLFATPDDPGRRDGSDPEPPEPEPPESEAASERPAEEERSLPAEPKPEAEPRETEPEVPPYEPTSERDELDKTPPAPSVSPPAETPEASPPEQHDAAPPAPDIVPPAPLDRVPPNRAAAPARPAPEAAPPTPAKRPPLQRLALALLIIAAAALIGYVLSRPSGREADADALVRSVEAAGRLQLRLETDTPAEARRYVRDEFGWRVGVPVFEAIPLRGVAIAQTAPAVEVPVFLYADDEGRNVAVFAYSYALLDQVPDRLRLSAADYGELDEGDPFVRRADGNEVVVWRDQDDIYVAVTDLPPAALTDGLAMAR